MRFMRLLILYGALSLSFSFSAVGMMKTKKIVNIFKQKYKNDLLPKLTLENEEQKVFKELNTLHLSKMKKFKKITEKAGSIHGTNYLKKQLKNKDFVDSIIELIKLRVKMNLNLEKTCFEIGCTSSILLAMNANFALCATLGLPSLFLGVKAKDSEKLYDTLSQPEYFSLHVYSFLKKDLAILDEESGYEIYKEVYKLFTAKIVSE